MKLEDYAIRIEPLPDEEGGGFLVTVPDLPGCMADGETVEEAIAEARDAFKAWMVAERENGGGVPVPKSNSGPPYRDWADYFKRAPRAGEDFVAVIEDMQREPLVLEDKAPLD